MQEQLYVVIFYISAPVSLLKIRDAWDHGPSYPALHALNGLFKAWSINRAGPSKIHKWVARPWPDGMAWHPRTYHPAIQVKCNEFVHSHWDRPFLSIFISFLHLSMLVARPWSHNNFGGKLFSISWPTPAFGYFRFRLVYFCFSFQIHLDIWRIQGPILRFH